jgi:putative DNA primase/helicase
MSDSARVDELATEAAELSALGLRVIPLAGKLPAVRGWHRRRFTTALMLGILKDVADPGIGVCMGPASGIIDVEYDTPAQHAKIVELCGDAINHCPAYSSSRGGHYWFAWSPQLEATGRGVISIDCGDGDALKVRIGAGGKGAQSAVPPSTGKAWLPGRAFPLCYPTAIPPLLLAALLAARPATTNLAEPPATIPSNTSEDVERCRQAMMALPDSIEGYGGDDAIFDAALLPPKFGLSREAGRELLGEWNDAKAHPPWDNDRCDYKHAQAYDRVAADGELGSYSSAAAYDSFEVIAAPPATPKRSRQSSIIAAPASQIAPVPVDWLIDKRVPKKCPTLLVGAPGGGKTTVVTYICACVSTGSNFADGSKCDRGKVVIINLEDDAASNLRPKLDSHGANLDNVFIVQGVRHVDSKDQTTDTIFTLEAVSALDRFIESIGGCALLVIDPIGAVLGGKVDSYKDSEVRAAMAPLTALAAKHGCAVLVVAHTRKTGGPDADCNVLGSRAFTGLARSVWHLFQDELNPSRRLLLPGKANLAAQQSGLAFTIGGEPPAVQWDSAPVNMTANEYMAAAASARQAAGRPADQLIEAELFLMSALADGPRPTKELIEEGKYAHSLSARTLERAKKSLGIEAFRPAIPGPWYWRLGENSLCEVTDSEALP